MTRSSAGGQSPVLLWTPTVGCSWSNQCGAAQREVERTTARPAPGAARRCETVTTRALHALARLPVSRGPRHPPASSTSCGGRGRADGRAPGGLGATRTVGLRTEISANPPGQMSNLRFTAKAPPKAPCKKALTSDFTLASSSLLRGVPTCTPTTRSSFGRRVLIAPTRSSNWLRTARAGQGPCPHRSYEEFQPPISAANSRAFAGPHRSYEEFQRVPVRGDLKCGFVLIAPTRSSISVDAALHNRVAAHSRCS